MGRNILVTTMICLICSSCSLYSINSDEISENLYQPKKSADEVLYIEKDVTQPYEVIGYVTANTERNKDFNDVIMQMKIQAAEMGGDAVTNIQIGASDSWKKLPGQKLLKNGYIRANYSATVIAFQSNPQPPAGK